jgi:GrpB-like predicted nucleotidyltransferase (UPF0157 family)
MKTGDSLQKRIDKVVREKVDIVPYDPDWVICFNQEAKFLKDKFPQIIKRVEHFGSTAVPDLSAKPIVDMLIEVVSFEDVKKMIVPALTVLGYDYFWRPEIDKPPYYSWFIKRDKKGKRTHHLHMVKKDSNLWDRLYFRDYLREHPETAGEYQNLKTHLASKFYNDREKYTKAKTEFIISVTEKAKKIFKK